MIRILLSLLLLPLFSFAQVNDDFTDGDFTTNPVWSGEDSKFTVNTGNQLQLNGLASTDTAYLSTANSSIDSAEWQFYVKMQFDPSNNNYLKVYLVSDQANLEGPLNGYFLRLGENLSNDDIDLYRQDGTAEVLVIDGVDGNVASSPEVRIRVTRDKVGNWELHSDLTGGTNFTLEGAGTDNTYTSSAFFGLFCRHTSSNGTKYYFDDFYVGPMVGDTLAPSIISVSATSDTTLDVVFSEYVELSSSQLITNYSANNGIGNPNAALRDGVDSTLLHLTFSTQFGNGVTNILTVSNVTDILSNAITTPETVPFTYFQAGIAVPGDVVINEIFADPVPSVSLPTGEFVELYNASTKIFDLNGWKFINSTTSKTLPTYLLLPNEYVILCDVADTAGYSPYGSLIGISSFTALTNVGDSLTLMDDVGTVLDIVAYDDTWYNDPLKENGGWTLEQINPSHPPCSSANNWIASNDLSGGTPGVINSVHDTLPDTLSPSLLGALLISPTGVVLTFSEAMDSASLASGIFTLNGGITVTSIAVSSPDFTTVTLTLNPAIDTGIVYSVKAGNVSDCPGNVISASDSAQFLISSSAVIYDVVISEIFVDPTPVIGLPEFEFVELYNASARVFDLSGWVFADAASSEVLGSVLLEPGGYIILCDASAASEFAGFGEVLEIVGFPSLTNGGEQLTLYDETGKIIHQIVYSDSWYADGNTEGDGSSLEMIDASNPCGQETNWRRSVSSNGGTPGQENSVLSNNPDNVSPTLLRADVIDSLNVLLTLSEGLDSAGAALATFSFSNSLALLSANQASPNTITLTLSTALAQGVIYTVSISNLMDCVGNGIGNPNSAQFSRPEQAEPGDIIINEILFNPRANYFNDGSDFVEIYNNSQRFIDLNGWQLANTGNDTIDNLKSITSTPYIVFPGDYVVLSKDTSNIKDEYPEAVEQTFLQMDALPGYNNGDGTVVLINNLLQVSDSITYNEAMHFVLLNDINGVSLERLDFDRASHDLTNWHSASEAVGFATPGYLNSQYNPPGESTGTVTIEPELFSPDNDGVKDIVNINYELDAAGFVGTITIYDAKGRLIKSLLQNELLGTSGTYSWDGITEENERARIGIYIIYFEVFGLNGEIKQFKKSCVLAANL